MTGGLKAGLARSTRWSRTEAGGFLLNWLALSALVIVPLVYLVLTVTR